MNDFFTQLETELGTLTRDGMHLGDPGARGRRRLTVLIRRSIVIVVLAIALAASLDSEFPATARGYAPALIAAAQPA
ncbi:MAG TPA: hypothetical protein VHU61_15090 [Solirubrobacteraceae bacterium]|jgi:hypothetical protein|nr:hypothetical protein [Solirubrobacteraceae bacterium]